MLGLFPPQQPVQFPGHLEDGHAGSDGVEIPFALIAESVEGDHHHLEDHREDDSHLVGGYLEIVYDHPGGRQAEDILVTGALDRATEGAFRKELGRGYRTAHGLPVIDAVEAIKGPVAVEKPVFFSSLPPISRVTLKVGNSM